MFQILSCNPLDQFQKKNIYQHLSFKYNHESSSGKDFKLFDVACNYFIIDYDDLSFECMKARELREWFIRYPELHREFLFGFNYFNYVFKFSTFNYLVYMSYTGKKLNQYRAYDFVCPRFRAGVGDICFFFELKGFDLGFGVAFSNRLLFINSEYLNLPIVQEIGVSFYFCNCIQLNTGEYLLNFLLSIPSVGRTEYSICVIVNLDCATYSLKSDFGVLQGKLRPLKHINSILGRNLFLFNA